MPDARSAEAADGQPPWLSWPLVAAVLRDAGGIFRRHALRIAPLGLVVFGAASAIELGLNAWVNRFSGGPLPVLVTAIVVTVVAGGASAAFATLFFTGLLDDTVDADMKGLPPPPLLTVLRQVPYLPLLAADLLVTLLTAVGALALVLPGLLAFTLLGLSGQLVVAHNLSPLAAMRRSFQLLRPRIGTALVLVLAPNLISDALADALQNLAGRYGPAGRIVAGALLDGTLMAYVALLLNVLAYRLAGDDSQPLEGTPGSAEV